MQQDEPENRELAALRRLIEDDKRRQARRFAVLRWELKVDYVASREQARDALTKISPRRRVAIVDRKSGETWSAKPDYRAVIKHLHRRGTALERPTRVGAIGRLSTPDRRRRGW